VEELHEIGVAVPQVSELAALLDGRWGTHRFFTTLDEAAQTLTPTRMASPRSDPAKSVQTGAMAAREPCVAVRRLRYRYDDQTEALRGIDLNIEEEDFVAVVGQNGSGKTTLVKHLNGLLAPTEGAVRVFGRDTRSQTVGQLARQVGYVFQNPDHQIFSPTVREELAFGPRNLGLSSRQVEARVEEALARFRLADHADTPPALLGYGLRRKVGVAAVYTMQPRLFILDEPTAGLDWQGSQELMTLLNEMNAQGHTILLVTHDMRTVAQYARRVIVLHQGRLLLDGDPRTVFGDAEKLAQAGIEPPQITQLAQRLAPWGVPRDLLTVLDFCEVYESLRLGPGRDA
jgi:cobalt transport protein ATP-binding subunit